MCQLTPPDLANRTSPRNKQCVRSGRNATGGLRLPGNSGVLMARLLVSVLVGLVAAALAAGQTAVPSADAAFAGFFRARTAREAADAADQIVASGIGFDEAFGRLRRGRPYSRDVPRGVVPAAIAPRRASTSTRSTS